MQRHARLLASRWIRGAASAPAAGLCAGAPARITFYLTAVTLWMMTA